MEACGGKNLGGVFIIWDRLFGTFEPGCDEVASFGIGNQATPLNPLAATQLCEVMEHFPGVQLAVRGNEVWSLVDQTLTHRTASAQGLRVDGLGGPSTGKVLLPGRRT